MANFMKIGRAACSSFCPGVNQKSLPWNEKMGSCVRTCWCKLGKSSLICGDVPNYITGYLNSVSHCEQQDTVFILPVACRITFPFINWAWTECSQYWLFLFYSTQTILRHLFILVRQTTNKPKYFPVNKLFSD